MRSKEYAVRSMPLNRKARVICRGRSAPHLKNDFAPYVSSLAQFVGLLRLC